MRVHQKLFDYGETGIVALSTSSSVYGSVPADFGRAMLWRDGVTTDLFELCTRAASIRAQKEAMSALRARLSRAVEGVQRQLDWCEARASEKFRELPSHARQMGADLLLLGFVGAIKPRCWRLVDVRQQSIVWESDCAEMAVSINNASQGAVQAYPLMDAELPLASGVDFVEIQKGMSRVIFLLEQKRLVAAPWSVKHQTYADNYGLRSGFLSQSSRGNNEFLLIDPHTGRTLKSFAAPTRSSNGSRPATTLGCDRIAISHQGGTVDIVDDFGAAHFSIRPFPQTGRTEAVLVCLSRDGAWLGAEGWHVFRVADLARRAVAELPVPAPNLSDDPDRVLYDRDALPTGHGIALMDQSGLSVTPYEALRWQPVAQPGRSKSKNIGGDNKQLVDAWRKPALTLTPSKQGRSWLYGTPDLPAEKVPWHDGKPMQLLARIDLKEVTSLQPQNPWPKQGALYFFTAVDAEGSPLEDAMLNASTTRVVWCGDAASSVEPAHELAPRQPLKLALHVADLPDISAAIVEAAQLDDDELETYRARLEASDCADQPPGHRLGGYPTVLQRNDLEAQAAHFADGAPYPPRDRAETLAASQWRLLLQLDSDDTCMWGTDSGVLYFMIHDADLARGDFSRVVSICEGL